jgi:hypothetical protein
MILDALLKTKSKAVLIDIINKNGSILLDLFHVVQFVVESKILLLCLYVFKRITVALSFRFADAAQHNEAV